MALVILYVQKKNWFSVQCYLDFKENCLFVHNNRKKTSASEKHNNLVSRYFITKILSPDYGENIVVY